jgi:cobalamin biosynthesis protein CbiD
MSEVEAVQAHNELMQKMTEFIQAVTTVEHLTHRITEIEKGLAYLLCKDPEWLKAMEERMAEEIKEAAKCPSSDSENPAQEG